MIDLKDVEIGSHVWVIERHRPWSGVLGATQPVRDTVTWGRVLGTAQPEGGVLTATVLIGNGILSCTHVFSSQDEAEACVVTQALLA